MTRLTYATALVLLAIDRGHRYGFDIMDATGLPDGTIYPALRRLEDRGLLAASWEAEGEARRESRPARRYYALTAAGEALLRVSLERYPALVRVLPAGEEGTSGLAPA